MWMLLKRCVFSEGVEVGGGVGGEGVEGEGAVGEGVEGVEEEGSEGDGEVGDGAEGDGLEEEAAEGEGEGGEGDRVGGGRRDVDRFTSHGYESAWSSKSSSEYTWVSSETGASLLLYSIRRISWGTVRDRMSFQRWTKFGAVFGVGDDNWFARVWVWGEAGMIWRKFRSVVVRLFLLEEGDWGWIEDGLIWDRVFVSMS
jgi:hypothetical protein